MSAAPIEAVAFDVNETLSAVTLSNGNAEVVRARLERAGTSGYLTRNLSVDAVRHWKPALEPTGTPPPSSPSLLSPLPSWQRTRGTAPAPPQPGRAPPGSAPPTTGPVFPAPEFSATDLAAVVDALPATRR